MFLIDSGTKSQVQNAGKEQAQTNGEAGHAWTNRLGEDNPANQEVALLNGLM